jgi:hypothetical protein
MNSSKDMGELVKHIFSLLAPVFLSPMLYYYVVYWMACQLLLFRYTCIGHKGPRAASLP